MPSQRPLDKEKKWEMVRNEIGCIEIEDHPNADNLAITLCTYFESLPDCPDEDPDENGRKPWAVKKTDDFLGELTDFVFTQIVKDRDERE